MRIGCLLLLLWLGCTARVGASATTTAGGESLGKFPSVEEKANRFASGLQFVSSLVFGRKTVSYTREQAGLTMIGAGFPRTGTKSLEAALQGLGHRIYDLAAAYEHGHGDRWVQAAREWQDTGESPTAQALVTELEALGYTATLDIPMNLLAIILYEIRPVKVIFGVRDSTESWVHSWQTINQLMSHLTVRPWSWIAPDFSMVQEIVEVLHAPFQWKYPTYPDHVARILPWYDEIRILPGIDLQLDAWGQLHDDFHQQVVARIPKDDLLVYNVKQGWVPLVPFLGLDESLLEQDFPRVNDLQTITTIRKVMDVIAVTFPLWVMGVFYVIYRILAFVFRVVFGAKKAATKKKQS